MRHLDAYYIGLRNAWFLQNLIYKGVYMFHLLSIVGASTTVSENFYGRCFRRVIGWERNGVEVCRVATHILVCVGVTLMMVAPSISLKI